jgi:hypothetical protein
MKNTHRTAVRLPLAALACAAALVTLTACNDTTNGAAPDKAAKPASSADTAPQAKANGIEKLTAGAIYTKAKQANADAKSFHERLERSDTKTDLRLSATECTGTVDKRDHGSYEIIVKDSDIWAKLDSQLAKELENRVPAGKWIHGTRSHPLMKALASYCHHEQITHPDTASTTMTKGPVKEVDGQPVVPVKISANGRSVTYFVATTGTPNLLSVDSSDNAVEVPKD